MERLVVLWRLQSDTNFLIMDGCDIGWGRQMFQRGRLGVPENHRWAVGEGDLSEDLFWAFSVDELDLNCVACVNRCNRGMLCLR